MAEETGGPSPLSGVWDRFMTPGRKVQYLPRENPETGEIETVAQEYDFSDETFRRFVENFRRTFSLRRLILDDGNHRAMEPGHVQPQELARYSGEAVIWGGQVIAFWDQFPDLPAPDPVALLSQLQAKFPRAESSDGLWGYRREVTPLGEQLLPNMSSLSPGFTMNDTDEAGNEIGPNILNVSPVYNSHQNGTVLMSKNTMGALSAPRPLGELNMADKPEDKKPENAAAGLSPEMRKAACAKYGVPETYTDGELLAHIMGASGIVAEVQKEDEKEVKDLDSDGMKKMGDMPEDMPAAMSKALFARLNEEAAARKAAEARLEVIEARERTARVAAFKALARQFVDDKDADEMLAAFGGDTDKASLMVQKFPRKHALGRRLTADGGPMGGAPDLGAGSTIEHVNGVPVIGRGLSAMSKKLLDEGKAKTLGEAQILAAKQAPHLYTIR